MRLTKPRQPRTSNLKPRTSNLGRCLKMSANGCNTAITRRSIMILSGSRRCPGSGASWGREWVGMTWMERGLEKVGLTSGSVFSNLDNDGQPDLVLACEWGPVRVFHNEGGKLKEMTEQWGLSRYTGWWNGVTTGDLDGDGRLDIIASNWGLNSKYRTSPEHPRKIYYGDLDGNGTVDVIEAYYDAGMKTEVPERRWRAAGTALPFLKEKFSTYETYGKASLKEIYGDKLKQMKVVEANTLESMAFLNRGDHFEARALPLEAQLAPAFAVCVAAYDGAGKEDLFLSQNFFPMKPETSRGDAVRGFVLKGDGKR